MTRCWWPRSCTKARGSGASGCPAAGGTTAGRALAYDGPADVTVRAPLGEVPVFVRAGAVIPLAEGGTGGDATVVLEAYPPAPGTTGGGSLVRDSGDGHADPVEERFTTSLDAEGRPHLGYEVLGSEGPSPALPHLVRWRTPR